MLRADAAPKSMPTSIGFDRNLSVLYARAVETPSSDVASTLWEMSSASADSGLFSIPPEAWTASIGRPRFRSQQSNRGTWPARRAPAQ